MFELVDVKTRVRELFYENGWIELQRGDFWFSGDLLFFKEEDAKMLFLVDVSCTYKPRSRAKRDGYMLWDEFKNEAEVYYSYAIPGRTCRTARKCHKRVYCKPGNLRRLRSMR